MAKYIFPAVFMSEDNGYSVDFPDLEGAATCGDSLEDAIEMAEDSLALTLTDYEDRNVPIPKPTPINEVTKHPGEFVTLVRCDTERYRKLLNGRAVKKTLSIPEWLNESAAAAGINFSQTLQEALKAKLGL
jgi:antitoxin HicB